MQISRIRTALGSVVTTALVAATTLFASLPASADVAAEEGTLTLPVTGEAHLAKRDTVLTLPAGAKMVGKLNPDFTVTGDLLIPDTTARMRIFGVPKLGDTTSTVRIVGTAPTQTTFDADGGVTVVNKVRIEIPRVSSDALPYVNVVRDTCRTGEITATLHGDTFDLFTPFPLEGSFTIPAFKQCGYSVFGLPAARDLLLTELLSGPDNTMSLMVGPVS